jgi:probable addiction module antidote protein
VAPSGVSSEILMLPESFGVNMPKKTRPYSELRAERLQNPEVASLYLNLAMEESEEAFLRALKNVAQARQMTRVAKESGIQRETLYRSLSESGNPTLDTLSSVLSVCGLIMSVKPKETAKGKSRTNLEGALASTTETIVTTATSGLFNTPVDVWNPGIKSTSASLQVLAA